MIAFYRSSGWGMLKIRQQRGSVVSVEVVQKSLEQPHKIVPVLKKARIQLDQYFRGRLKNFSLPVSLDGTDFQKKVWRALLKIPYGTTKSYQQVAKAIGRPKAVRAVASAIGANPICLVVPCHRVIGSNGTLTGYAYGLKRKKALLRLEGVSLT